MTPGLLTESVPVEHRQPWKYPEVENLSQQKTLIITLTIIKLDFLSKALSMLTSTVLVAMVATTYKFPAIMMKHRYGGGGKKAFKCLFNVQPAPWMRTRLPPTAISACAGLLRNSARCFCCFRSVRRCEGNKETRNSLFRGASQSNAWKTVSRIIKADSTEAASFSLWHRGFDHLRWRQCLCSPKQEETRADAENIPASQQNPLHPRIFPLSIPTNCNSAKVPLYFKSC